MESCVTPDEIVEMHRLYAKLCSSGAADGAERFNGSTVHKTSGNAANSTAYLCGGYAEIGDEKMKKKLALMMTVLLTFSLVACGSKKDVSSVGNNSSTPIETTNIANIDETEIKDNEETLTDNPDSSQEIAVPNNGEWDKVLCSGDGYHIVTKEIDTFDEYKVKAGVVNDAGEWVHELTDTGAFVEGIQLRIDVDNREVLLDSGSYMYLGEGVFVGSPGLTIYSSNSEYEIGPWQKNGYEYTDTDGERKSKGWECIFWNVVDNIQTEFYPTRLSTFNDGYALFTETATGRDTLSVINTQGEITETPCMFAPTDFFRYKFPVYSEGLFFSNGPKGIQMGFFDIEGNQIIDLSRGIDTAGIPYCEELGINAPYFENGEATIMMKNNGGSVYRVNIDKTGEYIGEPQKTDIIAQ